MAACLESGIDKQDIIKCGKFRDYSWLNTSVADTELILNPVPVQDINRSYFVVQRIDFIVDYLIYEVASPVCCGTFCKMRQ